jgi:hypothetical protein
MAQIINIYGEIFEVMPCNGTDFKLRELQGIVEGHIEILRLSNNTVMVVNEEGKFQCAYNGLATILAKTCRAIPQNDYINGNVLVCDTNQIK